MHAIYIHEQLILNYFGFNKSLRYYIELFLLQFYLAKSIFLLKRALVPITIERVKLMGEIFSSIKFIKMYAWEEPLIRKAHGKSNCAIF